MWDSSERAYIGRQCDKADSPTTWLCETTGHCGRCTRGSSEAVLNSRWPVAQHVLDLGDPVQLAVESVQALRVEMQTPL